MPSSPKVSVPGPTAAEQELLKAQTSALNQQRDILQQNLKQQQLLQPFLFEQAGVTPITGPGGEITGFQRAPTDPNVSRLQELETRFLEQALGEGDELQPLREQIERGLLERSAAALEGRLPVDPALMETLEQEESTLRDRLRRQLGPGFETSTPGIEALGNFEERKGRLLDAARRGDLTLAEGLGIARQSANQQPLRNLLEMAGGVGGEAFGRAGESLSRIAGVGGMSLPMAGGFGQLARGFEGPLGGLRSDRALRAQVNMANAQSQSASMGQLFGGLGSLAGLGLFAPLGGTGFGRLTGFG